MREETILTRDVEGTAIPYGDKIPLKADRKSTRLNSSH